MICFRWPTGRPVGTTVQVGFLVGQTADDFHQTQIRYEASNYNDLMQGNFSGEAGTGVTCKALLSAFNFITRYCDKTRLVVFCEDDVFLDIPTLVSETRNATYLTQMIYEGIPPKQQQNTDHFNQNASSSIFAISTSLILPLYRELLASTCFQTDDILSDGFPLGKLSQDMQEGVSRQKLLTRVEINKNVNSTLCKHRIGRPAPAPVVSYHYMDKDDIRDMWQTLPDMCHGVLQAKPAQSPATSKKG